MNPTQASEETLFAICSVLDHCSAQVPFNICMSGVLSVNGIGSKLGLAPGMDDPYSALESAESSGVISANLTAANTCVDTINNLNCTDPNVLNAYNPSSSNPFSAVPNMIPVGDCGQVFVAPVQYTTPVQVQKNTNSFSFGPALATISTSFASGNTAGNFIWVGVYCGGGGVLCSGATMVNDTNLNTYNLAATVQQITDGHQIWIFYAMNIAPGPNTVTAAVGVGNACCMSLEFLNIAESP